MTSLFKSAVVVAAMVVVGGLTVRPMFQRSAPTPPDQSTMREYTGVYQWSADAFVYLQMWNELTGTTHLTAFDESGEIRTLYAVTSDRFVAGPGAAVSTSVEARIVFHRNDDGRIGSLTWQRDGEPARTARRVAIETHHEVRFRNGDVDLSGTLIAPVGEGKRPAVVLVHGSGAADRDWTLPFARFLVRKGMAVLAYDKRGVGASTGDWTNASLHDLAGDVVAAVEYLKTRADIDRTQIGALGVSQAGWVMPLAALRVPDLAFLISVSGPGVSGVETTIDHARAEMTATGMPPPMVTQVLSLMTQQYHFARSGDGWETYAAARQALAARMGTPPGSFPGTPEDPYWHVIRRTVLYEPAPTLRRLQVPVLGLFGELDNNILAAKNEAAWDAALAAGGHRDYTLRIVTGANHLQLDATLGTNAEMPSLRGFVPEYFTTVHDWLVERVDGFGQ